MGNGTVLGQVPGRNNLTRDEWEIP
jgi:hypothetical protein